MMQGITKEVEQCLAKLDEEIGDHSPMWWMEFQLAKCREDVQILAPHIDPHATNSIQVTLMALRCIRIAYLTEKIDQHLRSPKKSVL